VKKIGELIIGLFMIAVIMASVSAQDQNTTNSATLPPGNATVAESPISTLIPSTTAEIGPQNTTPALFPTNSTPLPISTNDQATDAGNNTTTITLIPTTLVIPDDSGGMGSSAGNITAVSSPLGANILIDGVFYGYTPKTITGIPGGYHIIRLTLSGYYDYDGTIYILPGQNTSVYGTLPPLNGYPAQPSLSPEPATSGTTNPSLYDTVQPPSPPPATPLENPTILAAIIGAISVFIGALVTIFTHIYKVKTE
jgi:hypothetical protein